MELRSLLAKLGEMEQTAAEPAAENTEIKEAYIKSSKDAIQVLANLRAMGKQGDRGGPVPPGFASQVVNDLYDVMMWIEANIREDVTTEAAKPDFLDVDKDGDKSEPMKKALKDKEKVDEASEKEQLDAISAADDWQIPDLMKSPLMRRTTTPVQLAAMAKKPVSLRWTRSPSVETQLEAFKKYPMAAGYWLARIDPAVWQDSKVKTEVLRKIADNMKESPIHYRETVRYVNRLRQVGADWPELDVIERNIAANKANPKAQQFKMNYAEDAVNEAMVVQADGSEAMALLGILKLAGMPAPQPAAEEREVELANTPSEHEFPHDAAVPSGTDLHKQKGAYRAAAGADNAMAVEELNKLEGKLKGMFESMIEAGV